MGSDGDADLEHDRPPAEPTCGRSSFQLGRSACPDGRGGNGVGLLFFLFLFG